MFSDRRMKKKPNHRVVLQIIIGIITRTMSGSDAIKCSVLLDYHHHGWLCDKRVTANSESVENLSVFSPAVHATFVWTFATIAHVDVV